MTQQKPTHSLLRKLIKWLAVIVLATGVLHTWQRLSLNRQIATIHEGLRKTGLPTTPAEVDAYYKLPKGCKDSTDLWLAAFKASKKPVAPARLPILGTSLTTMGPIPLPNSGQHWKMLTASRMFLSKNASVLTAIHKAVDAEGEARFPVSFAAKANHTPLLHLEDSKTCDRWLLLASHVHAHDGDWGAVLQDVKAMLAVSRSAKHEPVLTSFSYGRSQFQNACDRVIEILPQHDWDDPELLSLQIAVRDFDVRTEFLRSLNGQRAMIGTTLDSLSRNFLPQVNELKALNLFEELSTAFSDSWSKGIRKAEEQHRELIQIGANIPQRIRLFAVFRTMKIYPYTARGRVPKTAVRQACCDILIGLKRYHIANSQYPDQLIDLVPEYLHEVPTDPFTGQHFKYAKSKTSIKVYSPGRDIKDDGGKSMKPAPSSASGIDVGYELAL